MAQTQGEEHLTIQINSSGWTNITQQWCLLRKETSQGEGEEKKGKNKTKTPPKN